MCSAPGDVRFTPESAHKSGHAGPESFGWARCSPCHYLFVSKVALCEGVNSRGGRVSPSSGRYLHGDKVTASAA